MLECWFEEINLIFHMWCMHPCGVVHASGINQAFSTQLNYTEDWSEALKCLLVSLRRYDNQKSL